MARIPINLSTGKVESKEEIIVGIDLGTTNSLVAYVNQATKKPVVIADENGTVITPSILYFSQDNKILVGDDAKIQLVKNPESTVYSVKRLMGKSFKDLSTHADYFSYQIIDNEQDAESLVRIRVGDSYYSPIELSAEILKSLKTKAEKALGQKISKAVITVPAYFNDAQRNATRNAGKMAGLDVLRIVNEPTAASLSYGLGLDGSKPRNVAVYDLGGGTFDVSILRIEDGIFEVLSTHGNTFLGGDDFDRCIMDVWLLDLKMNSDDLTSSELQELRLLAEKAKVELSTKQKFTSQFRAQSIHLNRNQFEACIAALVQSTIQHCEHALKDANFTHADVDEVVLVGGSTKVPLVQASVSKLFSKSTIDNSINPDEVVALGAAIEADVLAGNRTDVLLLDVTPLSLGIETVGGLMDVIIPRNSKVPCKAGRNYTTSVDGQVNLKIAVYQGERDQVSENRKLSEFVLNNLPSMPAGLPKIEIAFMLDADGILKVRAKELRSGVEQSIEVQPQYGLTDAEVEKMLMASMQHAAEDMAYRSLKEATNEAEHLVLNSEKFLNLHSNEITVLENSETKKRITELKAAILNQDKDKILLVHDALNDYTKPFAEIMMDSNIQKALRGKTI